MHDAAARRTPPLQQCCTTRYSHSIPWGPSLPPALPHLPSCSLTLPPSRTLVKGKAGERDSRGLPPARAIMSISNTTNCTQPRFCTGAPARGNDDDDDDDRDGVYALSSPSLARVALLNSP